MMIRLFKISIFQSRYTLFPNCKILFLYTWRKYKVLVKKGLKVVQILSVFSVRVSEDQLPGNENKTTVIVYIDVA